MKKKQPLESNQNLKGLNVWIQTKSIALLVPGNVIIWSDVDQRDAIGTTWLL